MVLSALFFSVMSFSVKLVGTEISSQQVVFVRSIVTLGFSYWALKKAGLTVLGPRRFPLILRGLSGFGALTCQYYAVTHLSLADATVLQYTSPVFTAVLAALILKEYFGKGEIVGSVASLLGVSLIARPDFLFGDLSHAPDLYAIGIALLGGVFTAFSWVAIRRLRAVAGILIIFYFSLTSTIMSFPTTLLTGWTWPGLNQWILLIFGVSLSAQFGQVFLTRGLHAEQAGRAASMSYLQIIFATVLGIAFLGELPSSYTIAGAVLIAMGTLAAARMRAPVAQDAVVDQEPTHSVEPSA